MTFAEIKALQKRMLNNPDNNLNSSAVGKFQFISATLARMQSKLGISDDALFDKANQTSMAVELLKERGLNEFKSGEQSLESFQNSIAKEWASIANTDGVSQYGQPVGTSSAAIQASLSDFKVASNDVDASSLNTLTTAPTESQKIATSLEQKTQNVQNIVVQGNSEPTQSAPTTLLSSAPESARNTETTVQRVVDRYSVQSMV
jgi:hypothetical protein